MPHDGPGQPPFEPTEEEHRMVEQMVAVGIPQESIAMVVRDGIDPKTLRKHFRRELDTAKTKANAKIGGTLFNKAIGGDTASLIFWAKTQMGWKEKSDVDLNLGVSDTLADVMRQIGGTGNHLKDN